MKLFKVVSEKKPGRNVKWLNIVAASRAMAQKIARGWWDQHNLVDLAISKTEWICDVDLIQGPVD